MSDGQQDPELRARFEAQRHDDARHAPPFARMLERARTEAMSAAHSQSTSSPLTASTAVSTASTARRTIARRYRIGALAAAAAIAALIVTPRMRSGDDAFEQAVRAFQSDPALGAWQSPTDGLLHLPGDGLLSAMPTVGTWPQ